MKRIYGENYLKELNIKIWTEITTSYVIVDRSEWEEVCRLLNETERIKEEMLERIKDSDLTQEMVDFIKSLSNIKEPDMFQKFERINLKPLTNE